MCSALPISTLPGHLPSANKQVTGSFTETDDTYLLQLQGNDEGDNHILRALYPIQHVTGKLHYIVRFVL